MKEQLEALQQELNRYESDLSCCKWWERSKRRSIKYLIANVNQKILFTHTIGHEIWAKEHRLNRPSCKDTENK